MNTISDWASLTAYALGLIFSLMSTGWVSAWWLNRKFNEVHVKIDDNINSLEKNIVQKLEYHERHDDERFMEIRNAVYDIRLRNAAKDGKV